MHPDIPALLAEHRAAIDRVAALEGAIHEVIHRLRQVLNGGGRVFVCGNGGSAADAQHFASEFTGRYAKDRPGYPVIALTTDTSALTAVANDYGFEQVFARQLQALARPGDLLLLISTSGNSPNLLAAAEAARALGVATIGLLGRDGGALRGRVDQALVVEVEATARIQEAHILILHLLCEAFEP